MKKLHWFLFFTLFLATVCSASATTASKLGWVESNDKSCAVCGGHFSQPESITAVPYPPSYKTVPVVITAKGPVIFRVDGASVLQQDVLVKQPGRIISADRAVVFRNQKTGKITDIQLTGHVRFIESEKLIAADHADYDVAHNTITMNDAAFHIVGAHQIASLKMPFDAWGVAKIAVRDSNNVIQLTHATFSTCNPVHPAWTLSAQHLILDQKKEVGRAKQMVLRVKNVPILYSPYYSFSLNESRKSGFLTPTTGYTSYHGFYFTQPFYWNIAPNHDLLITPEWYSQRGLQLNNLFRYLTEDSNGTWYASFLPNDTAFSQYKSTTLSKYASTVPDATLTPYLNELSNKSNDRGFIDLQNDFLLSNAWSAKVYARYTTDPYFAENFQSLFLEQNSDQLPSFAEVTYQGLHWNDVFLIQSYQTLHPIDQYAISPAQNQYTRLPEMDFSARYPQFIPNYNFGFSSQFVHFMYNSAYYPFTYQRPVGDRIHLQPSISRPFNWASGYFTPQLLLDTTQYFSDAAMSTPNIPRTEYDVRRTLPIVDIDTGWYFDRSIDYGEHHYMQTIEPRLFYLYVPYTNQDNYPNFDTQLLPFSAFNLFSLNQFTGFDRLQNANQISMGLSTNLIRQSNADNVLSADVGFIGYMDDQRVCLLQNCKRIAQSISPVTGDVTWTPNRIWNFNAQAAWDTALRQVNNASVATQYHFPHGKIALFQYQFTHGNPDTPFDSLGFSTNSSLITAGLMWPVSSHWNMFGYDYYDLTHGYSVNQYTGLSYDTCCYALRVIVSTAHIGTFRLNNGQTLQNQFTTTYYVQLLLKGLSSVGNHDAESMLTDTLPGFEDVFSRNGHYGFNQHY